MQEETYEIIFFKLGKILSIGKINILVMNKKCAKYLNEIIKPNESRIKDQANSYKMDK